VRVMVSPDESVMVRNVSFVARNLASVMVMGMSTAMEIRKARIREIRRRRRMRALRSWGRLGKGDSREDMKTYGVLVGGGFKVVQIFDIVGMGLVGCFLHRE
jgi:hypothetical protein